MKKLTATLMGLCLYGAQVSATILPPNKLHLQDRKFRMDSNVTEEQFNKITDFIINMWIPIAQKHGATLKVDKRWNDSTVNAYASQSGKTWNVAMFGGLARRPEVTPDAYALVVCHELGHHFAGYYFYGNGEWAASEGQSDYWATHVCGKKVFEAAMKNQVRFLPPVNAPEIVVKKCASQYKEDKHKAICVRSAMGGLSLATLLGALGGGKAAPKFETPDATQVKKTVTSHPQAQCRLDTYFAGAACPAAFDINVIPAKGANGGDNSPAAEVAAAKSSCMNQQKFAHGLRPRCWFAPQNPEQFYQAHQPVAFRQNFGR